MRWMILFLTTGLLLASSIGADPKSDTAAKKIKPIVQLGGSDSAIKKEEFLRCTTVKEWEQLWKRHREGKSPIETNQYLEVDFDTHIVIAIFQGEQGFHGPVDVKEVNESQECLTVRFEIGSVQTGDGIGGEQIKPVRLEAGSYSFIVLPKSKKHIKFEIDKRSEIAAPPLWKECGQLPAVKD